MPTRSNISAWVVGTLLGMGTLPALAQATSVQDWSYEGDSGPKRWAGLNPIYERCGNGLNQSPIDISSAIEAEQPGLTLDYTKPLLVVKRTINGISVEGPSGNTLTVNGHEYILRRIEFHSPAEHSVDGQHAAMEMELIHTDAVENTLILSVLVEPGEASTVLDRLWQNMPAVDRSMSLTGEITPDELLPRDRDNWQYNGSLTTPPCTEGVRWVIMKKPVHASQQQFEQLHQWLDGDNARPVQPLNARFILK